MTKYLLHIFNTIIRWSNRSLSLSKGRNRDYSINFVNLSFDTSTGSACEVHGAEIILKKLNSNVNP